MSILNVRSFLCRCLVQLEPDTWRKIGWIIYKGHVRLISLTAHIIVGVSMAVQEIDVCNGIPDKMCVMTVLIIYVCIGNPDIRCDIGDGRADKLLRTPSMFTALNF